MKKQGNNQASIVLEHLKKHQSITPISAFMLYHIFRLAPRIYDLRSQGWVIETSIQRGPTGLKYAKYILK